MDRSGKLWRENLVDHAVTCKELLSLKSVGHDCDFEVSLTPAGHVVHGTLILHDQVRRGELGGQERGYVRLHRFTIISISR